MLKYVFAFVVLGGLLFEWSPAARGIYQGLMIAPSPEEKAYAATPQMRRFRWVARFAGPTWIVIGAAYPFVMPESLMGSYDFVTFSMILFIIGLIALPHVLRAWRKRLLADVQPQQSALR